MSETFTLALTSDKSVQNGGFMINDSDKYNIQYQVNFDALFQGKNREYSKAQVRIQFISNLILANTSYSSTLGSLQLTGLTSVNSLGANGLYLSIYYPTNGNMTGLSGGPYYNISTLSFKNGTQVATIPTGIREFNVLFTTIGGLKQTGIAPPNYRMVLQFELYDPIV